MTKDLSYVAASNGALIWMDTSSITLDVTSIEKDVVFSIYGSDIERVMLRATPEQAQAFLNRLQDAIDAAKEVS